MSLPQFSQPRPRDGQWCKFSLRKPADVAKLESLGAHRAAGGHFVGIFKPAAKTPVVTKTGADGKAERSGGEVLPDRVVVVDVQGHDVYGVYKDPLTNAVLPRVVFFRTGDPDLTDLHPLVGRDDLPPGRVLDPAFTPQA